MPTFIVVLVACLLAVAFAMPYHVPLQGNAGGKRTLVLLDSMVFLAHIFIAFVLTIQIRMMLRLIHFSSAISQAAAMF